MIQKEELDFNDFNKICNILNTVTKMDISFISPDGKPILQLINHKMPEMLQSFHNDYFNINSILSNNSFNSYYYYTNSFELQYIASGIWREGVSHGFILIGPFLSQMPTTEFISDIMSRNHLPISKRTTLQEFYNGLTIISSIDSNNIGALLVNLCSHAFINSQLITSDEIKPILSKEELRIAPNENTKVIEHRYMQEKRLFLAISKGDKKELSLLSEDISNSLNIPDRIPESPIRSSKNLLFVLNTICRIAAKEGGVHPVYIHNISEKFAIMIEKAPNLPYLKKLSLTMINEYCDIVKTYSTSKYSPIVKKAVDHINLNLETPLTLKSIAASIHVDPSHLSRKFKNDTNMTVIDYINIKRVEEAKLYLQRGNMSITEIALMVGFNDLNYFGRVFKKVTSMTPSQYIISNKGLEDS